MSFYQDRIYPYLVNSLSNPAPIRLIRARIIPQAYGMVLEIGAGSGLNFRYYDPARVSKFYALEPNLGMIRLAERQERPVGLQIEFLGLPGERIPLGAGIVDTVVSTFTLCTIPAVEDAIHELRRVIRPGGQLLFFELGLSPDPRVRRWQERWEPFFYRAYAGLYLTREIPALLRQGGFQINHVERGYLVPFPKSWTHCCWGAAIPKSS